MGLKDLKDTNKNVHLLYSPSSMCEMYVYDTLKGLYEANLDSIYTINSKSTFNSMLELINIQSYVSLKWIFVLEYAKVKSLIKKYVHLLSAPTSCFLFKVKSYAEFKEFKEVYPKCNDMYLSILRKNDILFLLDGYALSPKLVDFVASSYRRDPEKVFILKEKLDELRSLY